MASRTPTGLVQALCTIQMQCSAVRFSSRAPAANLSREHLSPEPMAEARAEAAGQSALQRREGSHRSRCFVKTRALDRVVRAVELVRASGSGVPWGSAR